MGLMTLEGIVKGGQIRLKSGIDLPENAKVYVIFPEIPSSEMIDEDRLHSALSEQVKESRRELFDISDEWSDEDLAEFSQESMRHATTTILAKEQEGD